MRQSEFPLDPELVAELEAIDATLAGQIVDPEYAELAELTVMVAAERPQMSRDRALELDGRVLAQHGSGQSPVKLWRSWSGWAAGLSVAAAAALALVLMVGNGGGSNNLAGVTRASSSGGVSAASTSSTSHSSANQGAVKAPAPFSTSSSSVGSAKSASPSAAGGTALNATPPVNGAASSAPSTPAPTPSARKVISSAALQLSASSRWIDVVAQEVFDVVGQEKGIVRSSDVTAARTSGGYATFNLSIPSSSLSTTVTRLSDLSHSRVVSRTDGTQDVNGQYLSDQRHLADANALHTSLLKQLANATTQAQITSLQARIHDVEAQIASDQATLHHLEYQISFSQLSVTINGGPVPLPLASPSSGGHGFTIGRAAHDAVRVLTVAAGVALIVLAALVPIGLLVALGMWISVTVRRRRREHALDTA